MKYQQLFFNCFPACLVYHVQDPSYRYTDVGGAYVGPTQDRILRMCNDLGLKTYKIFNKGDYVHFSKVR